MVDALLSYPMTPLLLVQVLITGCLVVFLGIVVYNLYHLKSLSVPIPERQWPSVSICVPARNEEAVIERCLRSLLIQSYPEFEVIVLNDHSSDKTGQIIDTLKEGFPSLKVLSANPLPVGWLGKSWACHSLSNAAKGELILFTDADTWHAPDALKRAVTRLLESRAEMLTAVPYQVMESFWEKQGVPLMHFLIMAFLPMAQIWRSKNPAFAFACGQFLLFRRDAYLSIGGHTSVKQAMVEDVWLVKEMKKKGYRVMVFRGEDAVSCRMYASFRDVWNGFSKNLFPGLGYSVFGLLGVIGVMAGCFLFPLGFIVYSAPFTGVLSPEEVLSAIHIVIALSIKGLIAWRFRLPMLSQALYPISIVLFIAIGLNSFYRFRFAGGAQWKGRKYNFMKPVSAAVPKGTDA